MYRCACCHRRLLEPAYTAPAVLGGWMLGPVCLERERAAGRLPPLARNEAARQQRRAPKRKRDTSIPSARRVKALPGQLALDLQ